ncbi:MAG: hypothetical protein R6V58_10330, partial [Planctomycetota bacterium]
MGLPGADQQGRVGRGDLVEAGNVRGDHRQRRGHGLGDGQAEPLPQARLDEQIASRQDARYVVDMPQHVHAIAEADRRLPPLDHGALATVAGQDQ